MKKRVVNLWKVIKETGAKFVHDNPMSYSAAIAFYTIFSLPGILIVTVYVVGAFYDEIIIQGELFYQIKHLVGPQAAKEAQTILANAELSDQGAVARTVGIITLLFSATTVFVSLQEALNKIWGLRAKPRRGWLKLITDRLLSLAMIISIGFLLLVSLVLDALLALFKTSVLEYFKGISSFFINGFNIAISFGLVWLIFGFIFKVLPDAKIKWKDVSIGALITALLFTLGKFLIGLYLGTSTLGSTYGAAGSLVLLLIWIYYSATILLLGAEFTFVYSKNIGSVIMPARGAVKVFYKEEEKENTKVNT